MRDDRHSTTIHMLETDLAWLAGFFDGEGCCTPQIAVKDQRIGMRVSIAQTDISILLWIKSHFGGAICEHRRRIAHHQTLYTWRLTSEKAIDFLRLLLPYLRVKKQIAQAMIEYREKHPPLGPHRRTEEQKVVRMADARKIQAMAGRRPKVEG